jgi:SAM-dependent MidA family methyltransferase
VHGPIGQGHFLAGIGITERAQQLIEANPEDATSVIAATERLIGPNTDSGQMGSLFKAVAVVPASQADVAGFPA